MGMIHLLATGTEIAVAMAVVSIALTAASYFLLNKGSKNPDLNAEEELSNRNKKGEYLPVVYGTEVVGAFAGVRGDRFTVTRKTSGGGKGIGGKSPKVKVYVESGWHQISAGVHDKLTQITSNKEVIWEGQITREGTPSGSTIVIDQDNYFQIYWGENDQPICQDLVALSNIPVRSRWPNLCYIFWGRRELGQSPIWEQHEYKITKGGTEHVLAGIDPWLIPNQERVNDGDTDTGVNPAQALYHLCTAPYPAGRGIDPLMIDNEGLLRVAEVCQDEHLPMNFKSSRGQKVSSIIETWLADLGVQMVNHQGRLSFSVQRPMAPEDIPTLPDQWVSFPVRGDEVYHGDDVRKAMAYTYRNAEGEYAPYDIGFSVDQYADVDGGTEVTRSPINMTTNTVVAARIASRRSQEASMTIGAQFKVARAGSLMYPGMVFKRPGGEVYRVISTEWASDKGHTKVDCLRDLYGSLTEDFVVTPDALSRVAKDAANDLAVRVLPIPASLTPGSTTINVYVLRSRAHSGIIAADIYGAPAGSDAFRVIGSQDAPAVGLKLLEALQNNTTELDYGPLVQADNADALDLDDLVGSDALWQAGEILFAVGDELVYLRGLEPEPAGTWLPGTGYAVGNTVSSSVGGTIQRCIQAGTSGATEPDWPAQIGDQTSDGTPGVEAVWETEGALYRLRGVIRAQRGTSSEGHLVGTKGLAASISSLDQITAVEMQSGLQYSILAQPRTVDRGLRTDKNTVPRSQLIEHVVTL